ncbi:endonuclease/exonuclease/phosphatase family protein [Rhizobium bangladeshense]|uniref:Endonuclease/exonuclease/phosphatase family protein n=1 Tax=Rhizobium bangladeshense TaxID=1138189 RepID=A0ABS7LLP6_9HYPH|nr:endonuclease/exonuclease/phosphatase family protein [Rhizobium bangladeshense]MBX4867613.1 endonuclease/exonuclease/phosphatase family protein [Rhizobium bangladeshense]MBX4871906.1 endonuclease/exonuclease/phosphatase family protein [Rhizobium bangladeshense]MBX4883220.1 endonuclease/exonuclease/phosphatase family protein [Rhizobium bangladeshense]MBX4901349.1 endonuclease/exonuclease/phosphatase family protein [Rhizobium bangladeshense]MBX4923293.1 endonuclease/exonuclease/phosphatase fam
MPDKSIKLLTYNVHSCIGNDRKLDPGRIASVIAEAEADIVALQEVDVLRRRTGGVDQAHTIASLLKMQAHFHPALSIAEEQYGDAIITALPTGAVKAGPLPSIGEARGALSVEILVGGRKLLVVNTHLGLRGRERIRQMTTLLNSGWLHGSSDEPVPSILCGDFNAIPSSATYRLATRSLTDAQLAGNAAPRATFPSRYPLMRLDHIFVTNDLVVERASVLETRLTRVASDHLPLVADISFA